MDALEESAPVELDESRAVELTQDLFEGLKQENSHLHEALQDVIQTLRFEDRGWQNILDSNLDMEGITLDELKEASERIRPLLSGQSLLKQGSELRIGNVWSKGVVIQGSVRSSSATGSPTRLQKFCSDPVNRASVFSPDAHGQLERALYSDGNVILVGNSSTRQIRRIPIFEITDVLVNPDFPEEIWAYQRTWRDTTVPDPSKLRVRWYYTNRFKGARRKTIGVDGNRHAVDPVSTIFDLGVNKQVGWPLGIPDALAAVAWALLYSQFMKHGQVMSESLAKFAFKIVNKTAAGAKSSAVKVSKSRGTGQTTSLTEGQDLTPLASAGKGYDFDSGRALAAQVAAALGISVVHLLADPGASGASYGSASNLDAPTKRNARVRQNAWIEFLGEVIEWGTTKRPEIFFPEIDDRDPFREMQMLATVWAMGLAHDDEAREKGLELLNIDPKHDNAPTGVLLPNNEFSLARKDIDTDGAPTGTGEQGQPSAFVGNGMNANDLRSDVLSNALTSNQLLEEILERLARMESKKD